MKNWTSYASAVRRLQNAADADKTALLEVHDDTNYLGVQIDLLAQGTLNSDTEEHIIETVKESILTHILETGYNAKIVQIVVYAPPTSNLCLPRYLIEHKSVKFCLQKLKSS